MSMKRKEPGLGWFFKNIFVSGYGGSSFLQFVEYFDSHVLCGLIIKKSYPSFTSFPAMSFTTRDVEAEENSKQRLDEFFLTF